MDRPVLYALLAAALFGASTPFAKLLGGTLSPLLLAGLLYLGSGIGLALVRGVRDRGWTPSGLQAGQWPWLLGAVFFGGVVGPVALFFGLTYTPASTASLLLNLEAVLTAVLAWMAFKEHASRRVVMGMAAIAAGGIVLSWPADIANPGAWAGPVLVAVACLCWAIDNNLTRKVAASDALFIASSKGLIAGTVNALLALLFGAALPGAGLTLAIMTVGLLGYGSSLVLFVLALRGLGAARTGAYFATAPFIGSLIAFGVLGETPSWTFWWATGLMGWGVWLHVTERHTHDHTHEALTHAHSHVHDAHHQHSHAFAWDGHTPHAHVHRHTMVTHKHAHFPDSHHQHVH